MSKKVVHLTKVQRMKKKFSHPLLNNAPPALLGEQLEVVLERYFTGNKEARDELIFGHFRYLRALVARYLYYWPITRPFLDEMVSVGLETIVEAVDNLKQSDLDSNTDYSFLRYLRGRIIGKIEREVNDLRAITSASRRRNQILEGEGTEAIYRENEADLTNVNSACGCFDSGFIFLEMQDILKAIAKNNKERGIIAEANWGLSNKEIAQKCEISERQVRRIRLNLLKRYYTLIGD